MYGLSDHFVMEMFCEGRCTSFPEMSVAVNGPLVNPRNTGVFATESSLCDLREDWYRRSARARTHSSHTLTLAHMSFLRLRCRRSVSGSGLLNTKRRMRSYCWPPSLTCSSAKWTRTTRRRDTRTSTSRAWRACCCCCYIVRRHVSARAEVY